MVNLDPDALTCDMAETYGVFDLYALPVRLLATLACGLREDSRIMKKMSGLNHDTKTLIMAKILDMVNILAWQNTKNGIEGKNMPESIYDFLLNPERESENKEEYRTFETPEDFMEAWNKITQKEAEG